MSITFGPSTPITNRSDLVNMTPPPPPSCGLVVGTGALDSLPPTASEGPVSFCVGPKPLLTSGMMHGPSPVTQSIAQEIDSIVEREQAFCRDYKCCGSQLADLFELLDHFEECHVGEDGQVVISPCLLPMANAEDQTDRFHTGEDSGCDHVEHGSRPSDTCDRLPPAMSSGSDGENVLREFKLKPSRQSGDQQQRAPSPRRPTHLLSLSPKSMANKSPSNASAPASPPLTPPAEQAAADYISRFQKDNGSNPAADASSGFPTASACANTGRTGDRTPPQSSAAPPGVWSPEPSPHRLSSTRLTSTDPPRAPSPETLRIALSVAQEWCATNAATPSDPFAFPGATGLQSPPPTSLVRSPDVNWHSRTALTAGMPASPVSPMAMHIDPPTPCPYPFQGWAGTGAAPTNASHKRTRTAALARVGGLGIDSDVDLSESDMSDMDSKGSAGKDSKSAVGAQKDVVRYHPCTVEGCVRGYQTTSGLRTHLASVHGIVFPSHLPPTKSSLSSSTSSTSRSSTLAALDQPSGVAFQCPVPTCPRSYASKSGLKYHILSSHQGLAQAASSGGGSSAPAPAAASTAAKLPVAAGARRKRKTRRVSDSPPLSSTSVTGLASSSGGSHASPPPPMPGQQQQPKFSQPPMPVKTPNKDVPPRRSLRQASRDADKRRGA